ncbi:hypothetical protein OE564_05190, partial [Aeromonas hydrophila]|uniref:hypothetical protein n=1 Tax=Aeromonas hydrophila TaxID=644 RepID=UPI0021F41739
CQAGGIRQGATVDQGMIVSLFPVNAIWVNSYVAIGCRPRHFCHVEQGAPPSSPSSVTANAAFIIQIISLFSYVCDFMTDHLSVLV